MNNFKFDIDKSINATLFVLKNIGGTCDFHKVFKILYYSDQKHLSKFGRPVTGDRYIAMKNGPVPSNLYEMLNALKDDSIFSEFSTKYKDFFNVKFYFVTGKKEPELEYLSETDLECLQDSIIENKDLSFQQLTEKSHDAAYENALKNDSISFIDMAKEGGANDAILKYINLNLENERAFH